MAMLPKGNMKRRQWRLTLAADLTTAARKQKSEAKTWQWRLEAIRPRGGGEGESTAETERVFQSGSGLGHSGDLARRWSYSRFSTAGGLRGARRQRGVSMGEGKAVL